MIENYDDGRCKNFCIASTLLSIESLNKSIKAETTIKLNSIDQNDLKNKAKLLKEILNRYADEENETLKLKNKKE